MNANELRIGSIIDFDGMKSIVKEIDNQGVVVFIKETDETEWIDLFQFTPITLTEEILLKCGFKYDEHKKYQELILPNRHQELIGFTFQGEFRLHYRVLKITLNDIKYLHQLQNLYYCLVGKELEIEL